MLTEISIGALIGSEAVVRDCGHVLSGGRFQVSYCRSRDEFLETVSLNRDSLDCLIIDWATASPSLTQQLAQRAIVMPVVILINSAEQTPPEDQLLYHSAEVLLTYHQLDQLPYHVDAAISAFLRLAPIRSVAGNELTLGDESGDAPEHLLVQQQRLLERLKERLGYLGVYYKRDPQRFLRNLSGSESSKLLNALRGNYREIVLNYFTDPGTLNLSIDSFVNMAFFADIPVTQIVGIHSDLMDDFSKQLKLEGRADDILLDYRLTLIDVIAHLCEMYRRSIPRDT